MTTRRRSAAAWPHNPRILRAALAATYLLVMLTLVHPAGALAASPPTVDSGGFIAQTAATGQFYAEVHPNGDDTTSTVYWDMGASTWCQSGGVSGSPAHSAAATPTAGWVGFGDPYLSISGLTGGQTYCGQLVATNAGGTTAGPVEAFVAGAPDALTFENPVPGSTSVTITGQIGPADQSTTYDVGYDLAGSAFCQGPNASGTPTYSTASTTLPQIDSNEHNVSVLLSSLTPGTSYCAQITDANASGRGAHNQITFTTPGPTSAVSGAAAAIDDASAVVQGQVDPAGQPTTYHVDYDLASSVWCESGAASGTPAGTTAPVTMADEDGALHDVSVTLGGLLASTSYCARLVSVNATNTALGSLVSFTEPAVPVITVPAPTPVPVTTPPPGVPPAPPTTNPAPGGAPRCTVHEVRPAVAMSGRDAHALGLVVHCDQAATVHVRGEIVIPASGRGRRRTPASTRGLGEVSVRVTAGAEHTVILILPSRALAALAQAPRRAQFTLTASGAHGSRTATVQVGRLRGI